MTDLQNATGSTKPPCNSALDTCHQSSGTLGQPVSIAAVTALNKYTRYTALIHSFICFIHPRDMLDRLSRISTAVMTVTEQAGLSADLIWDAGNCMVPQQQLGNIKAACGCSQVQRGAAIMLGSLQAMPASSKIDFVHTTSTEPAAMLYMSQGCHHHAL